MSRIRADRYTNREGTGAPTFSAGVNVVGVTSMSGDLAVTNGTITGPSQLTISGITSSISDTAVDVFVYDTSKDSDGGAWRKRTQNTSWYNETLNTATRGSRKEFPAVAVIVVDSTFDLTIYDGDDPDLPMWMKFENSGFLSWSTGGDCEIKTVSMLNGIFVTGGDDGDGGIHVNFVSDHVRTIFGNGNKYDMTGAAPIISNRSATVGFLNNSGGDGIVIVNTNINDVAMTVLPNAPIDPSTGLPIPTIAVATDGGVSVIKDDGNVFDFNDSLGGTRPSLKVGILGNDIVYWNINNGTMQRHFNALLATADSTNDVKYNYTGSGGSATCENVSALLRDSGDGPYPIIPRDSNSLATGAQPGMSIFVDGTDRTFSTNSATITDSRVAYTTSNYNTGWMHGDIKGAFLSDTDDTNKTNGQTDPDRSVENTALTVYGTVTKTPVATGADLVAYSGFSASNYLKQSYNSDLDFGTGDFYVGIWAYGGGESKSLIIREESATDANGSFLIFQSSSAYQFYVKDDGASSWTSFSGTATYGNYWSCVYLVRSGDTIYGYVNGEQVGSVGFTGSVTNNDAELLIGARNTSAQDTQFFDGSLALARVGAGAPSAEQIKKIYDDERWLFQENAKCTLYGSSDAVTALAYDDTTDILHVGTSAGRSEFQGLRRINNTTVGITSAISASNELVAEQ